MLKNTKYNHVRNFITPHIFTARSPDTKQTTRPCTVLAGAKQKEQAKAAVGKVGLIIQNVVIRNHFCYADIYQS